MSLSHPLDLFCERLRCVPYSYGVAPNNVSTSEILAEFVTTLGYLPLVAHNGQQVLALVHVHWPTLVITDQMMAHMVGIKPRPIGEV